MVMLSLIIISNSVTSALHRKLFSILNNQTNLSNKEYNNISNVDLKKECKVDVDNMKYYYYLEKLEIDISKQIPVIKTFNIYVMSNAGMKAGWNSFQSFISPIHFVYLDIENSSDFLFIKSKPSATTTNLEHPGHKYSIKVGFLFTMNYRINSIKFHYDQERKIIYNKEPGVIGKTSRFSKTKDRPERGYLRISLQSILSSEYLNFIIDEREKSNRNMLRDNLMYQNTNSKKGIPTNKPVRIDYKEDPSLTEDQIETLSSSKKFIYSLLHNKTDIYSEKTYKEIESKWKGYSRSNDLDKYNQSIYFDFTSENKGERMISFDNNFVDPREIELLYRQAHFDQDLKLKCGYKKYYPFKNWIRMPNDQSFDPQLDYFNSKNEQNNIFENLSISDIFGHIKTPSIDFFGLPEPKFKTSNNKNIRELGIYNENQILDRFYLREKNDVLFRRNNLTKIKWFPLRHMSRPSYAINLQKTGDSGFAHMKLRETVDRYGWVLYSNSKKNRNSDVKEYLLGKYKDILFEEGGNQIIFVGKVVGFVPKEIIDIILKIGIERNYSIKGFYQVIDKLKQHMEIGFGKKTYLKIIKRDLLKKMQKKLEASKKKSEEIESQDYLGEKELFMIF